MFKRLEQLLESAETSSTECEKSSRPDPEVVVGTAELPIFRSFATYQNGETEEFLCGKVGASDHAYLLRKIDDVCVYNENRVYYDDDEEYFIPFETLSRPIESEECGTTTVEFKCTYPYQWDTWYSEWEKKARPNTEILSTEYTVDGSDGRQ